jgi:TolB-like protein
LSDKLQLASILFVFLTAAVAESLVLSGTSIVIAAGLRITASVVERRERRDLPASRATHNRTESAVKAVRDG